MLHWIWQTSVQAAVVSILVLLLRIIFGRVITARWRHALWLLVLIRLMIPVLPTSRFSLFTLNSASRSSQLKPTEESIFPNHLPGQVKIEYGSLGKSEFTPSHEQITEQKISWWKTPVIREAFGVGIWLVIAVASLTRLAVENIRFTRRLARESIDAPADLVSLLDECCSKMKVTNRPLLLITNTVVSPAVAGILRPRILLPGNLIDQVSRSQIRLIFLHELTHVKCHDLRFDWVWAVLQSMHWFNPVLWIIGPLRRSDRELARDEMVLSVTGSSQADAYGKTLLQLAKFPALPSFYPGMVGLVTARRRLKNRVERIARFSEKTVAATWAGLSILIVAASCTLTNPKPIQPLSAAEKSSNVNGVVPVENRRDTIAPTEAETRAALEKSAGSLEFKQMPLDQVIDRLRNNGELNIYVDWPALSREGINQTTPVTARFRDIKFSKALQLIFKAVEGDDPRGKLGYAIDEGVVTITTKRELAKNVVTRRYDVSDLTRRTSQPIDQIWSENQLRQIQNYITANVDRESWLESGGQTSTMQASLLRSVLLITATLENHHKIETLLATLRNNQSHSGAIFSQPAADLTDEKTIETVRYPISDLLFQPRDYFLDPPKNKHQQENLNPAQLLEARVTDVTTYIQSTVATSSWKAHGGDVGTIESDSSKEVLVITQKHNHQREITRALETLRQNRSPQASVETRILLLDEATVNNLRHPLHERVAALSGVGRNRTDQFLSEEEVKQFLLCASESKSNSTLTSPRLTLFSGQHAYVEVAEKQAYVESMTASQSTVNGKATWAFTPVVGNTYSTGYYLPCTTCNAPDQRSVFIDMQPKFTRLLGLLPEYWNGPVSDHDAIIQKPILVEYERSLTCAIPDHATLLCTLNTTISDSRDPKALHPTDEKMNDGANRSIEWEKHRQAFLLVTPKIIPTPVAPHLN